jgi:hypothetical protein
MAFISQNTTVRAKKLIVTLVSTKKAIFLSKIAENIDRNIDPYMIFCRMARVTVARKRFLGTKTSCPAQKSSFVYVDITLRIFIEDQKTHITSCC